MEKKKISPILKIFLDYEINSHWLASYIWFEWGQLLMGKYFAWKVNRKYKRHCKIINFKKKCEIT